MDPRLREDDEAQASGRKAVILAYSGIQFVRNKLEPISKVKP
jgi:hypothetical protein